MPDRRAPDTATSTAHSADGEAEPLEHETCEAAQPARADTDGAPTEQFGEERNPPAGCSGLVAGPGAEALLRVAQVIDGFVAGNSSLADLCPQDCVAAAAALRRQAEVSRQQHVREAPSRPLPARAKAQSSAVAAPSPTLRAPRSPPLPGAPSNPEQHQATPEQPKSAT